MAFSRYKPYKTPDLEPYKVGTDNDNLEILYSNEYEDGWVPREEIEKAIRSPLHKRYYRIYLLHDDETIKEDITEYVVSANSIERTSESGQNRSTSITLLNNKAKEIFGMNIAESSHEIIWGYRNKWAPGNNTKLWINTKIKIVIGIELGNMHYLINEGIYYLFDPTYKNAGAENVVEVQCYDKYAFLDGTIRGNSDDEWNIPVNSAIHDVMDALLKITWDKRRTPLDYKNIRFPKKYENIRTAYTIKKTGENNEGEIIKDLALMISCDARYDDDGYLVISDILDDLDYHNRAVAWNFREGEIISPSMTINRSKIRNKIVVVGTNINGYLCTGKAENTNPNSLYNVDGRFGIVSQRIEDNLIYSDRLCEARARYELKKYSQNYINMSFSCPFIPHLEPGDIVRITHKEWNIDMEDFLVNSVSIPLNTTENMSLNVTNLKDLPL